jgi:hypothetical protein
MNVHTQTEPEKTCYLVDVTDSALLVTTRAWSSEPTEQIALSKISHLTIQRNTTPYGWIGGLSACTLVTGGAIISEKTSGKHGDGSEGVFGLLSFPLGAFIGCNVSDNMEEIDLGSPDALKWLKRRSFESHGCY